MPPAGSEFDTHTVAQTTIDGKPIVDVNSKAPGYTQTDRDAADKMRDILVAKFPNEMNTQHLGQMPSNALYYAEATALLRAAGRSGGTLSGKIMDVYVDREMCRDCGTVLRLLSRELGNPTVNFVDRSGLQKTMRQGEWVE